MDSVFNSLKGPWKGVLSVLVYAAVTAFFTLSLAFGLSGGAREAQETAAKNIAITRAGVDTALCVLLTDPSFRSQETIETCAKAHGYSYTPPAGVSP